MQLGRASRQGFLEPLTAERGAQLREARIDVVDGLAELVEGDPQARFLLGRDVAGGERGQHEVARRGCAVAESCSSQPIRRRSASSASVSEWRRSASRSSSSSEAYASERTTSPGMIRWVAKLSSRAVEPSVSHSMPVISATPSRRRRTAVRRQRPAWWEARGRQDQGGDSEEVERAAPFACRRTSPRVTAPSTHHASGRPRESRRRAARPGWSRRSRRRPAPRAPGLVAERAAGPGGRRRRAPCRLGSRRRVAASAGTISPARPRLVPHGEGARSGLGRPAPRGSFAAPGRRRAESGAIPPCSRVPGGRTIGGSHPSKVRAPPRRVRARRGRGGSRSG